MSFSKLEAMASRAVDRTFGERIRVDPRADGTFVRGGADGSRASFEATAIIDMVPVIASAERGAAQDASIVAVPIQVSFAASSLPYLPRKGDLIVPLGRADARFVIVTVEPDGIGRVLCRCQNAGDAP